MGLELKGLPMTFGMILTIVSVVGLFFSIHEISQSYKSMHAARNKFNGRKIVARYLFFKSILYTAVLLDFAALGGVLTYLAVVDASYETVLWSRKWITVPMAVFGSTGFVCAVVAQTVTRIRLEREYFDSLSRAAIATQIQDQADHVQALTEDTNRLVREQAALQGAELRDRTEGRAHRGHNGVS